MKWDKERLVEILIVAGKQTNLSALQTSEYGTAAVEPLEKLIDAVRAEAIGWTWTEACSQYSRGLNPGKQFMPDLLKKAEADLNPERDK